MKIESSSSRGNFMVMNGQWKVLELKYPRWFSTKAVTRYRGREIRIEPKGFWGSSFVILKNGREIGDITFNWKGQVNLRIEDTESIEHRFMMKAKGTFKLRFELYDDTDHLVLTMKSQYNWRKWSSNYDIETSELLESMELPELLLYCGYMANAYVSRMGAA